MKATGGGVYDARREHCGDESVQRLAGAGASRTVIEVERQAVEEGRGLGAGGGGAPTLAQSLEDARRLVEGYVEHYNNVRLNSAIGYITPKDMLAGHQQEIQAERDRKLDAAKEQRKNRRQGAA